jgi:hypothetical protein
MARRRPNFLQLLNLEERITPVADPFDPNESFAAASDFGRPVNLVVNGNSIDTSNPNDVDWHTFRTELTGTNNDLVRIDLTHANGNLDIELYDANQNLLGASTTLGDREEISLSGRPAGQYYLKVFGVNNATGDYKMRLNGNKVETSLGDRFEPNNSPVEARTYPNITNGFGSGGLSIHEAGDSDWVFIQLQNTGGASDQAKITHTSSSGNLDMELYAVDGMTKLDSATTANDTETISFNGRAAGAYYVRVFAADGTSTNSYSLYIDGPAPGAADAFEGNNTAATATIIGTVQGQSIRDNLSINTSSDVDWFRFQLPTVGVLGSKARIDFDHSQGNLDIALYKADGITLIRESTTLNSGEWISLNKLNANTDYLLKVYHHDGNVNPYYRLAINSVKLPSKDGYEQNNTQSNATNLGSLSGENRFQDLSIHNGLDHDWFQFTTQAAGQLSNFVKINFEAALGNLDLYLLDGVGNVLGSSESQGDSETLSLAGLPAGTYYVEVAGFEGAVNRYELMFDAPRLAAPDRFEGNNTSGTATQLGLVTGPRIEQSLSISTTGDEDWFQFTILSTAEESHRAWIEFDHILGDLDIELFSTSGAILGGSRGVGNIETLSLNGLVAGSYWVRILGASGATNPNYTLNIQAPANRSFPLRDSQGTNSSTATASRLYSGTASTLTAQTRQGDVALNKGESDYFQFTTVATGKASDFVRIEFENSDGNLDLQLLAADGVTVLATAATKGDVETISLEGRPAGTYFVRTFGRNANVSNYYNLAVRPPNPAGQLDSWTIMVYITASDLTSYINASLVQLEQAMSKVHGSVNIAVLLDQSSKGGVARYSTGNGTQAAWGGTGRAFLTGNSNVTSYENDLIATTFDLSIGERNTGDGAQLTEFINWAKGEAPAQHYGLIMWNHGAGIGGLNFDGNDAHNYDYLSIPEFATALQASNTIFDFVGYDECSMAMVEVAYATRNNVINHVAAQESITWGIGYPYAFDVLINDPYNVSADTMAASLVQTFAQINIDGSFYDVGEGDTFSAIRTSALTNLTMALNNFVTTVGVPATSDLRALQAARNATIGYGSDPDNPNSTGIRDLGTFMQNIVDDTSISASIRNAANGVLAIIPQVVVAKTDDVRNSSGIAILLPEIGSSLSTTNPTYTAEYPTWNAATGWGTFLNRLMGGSATAASRKDWSEPSSDTSAGFDLRTVTGSGNRFTGLSTHNRGDNDWFRFTTSEAGIAGNSIVLTPTLTTDSLTLTLFAANGTTQLGQTSGTGTRSVSLSGLAAGTYLARVNSSAAVQAYSLVFNTPGAFIADWAGDNSTQPKAYPLGPPGTNQMYAGLMLAGNAEDWFTFNTVRLAQPYSSTLNITIADNTPVTVQVLNAAGQIVGSASGTGDLSVNFTAPGNAERYTVKVVADSANFVRYSMTFDRGVVDPLNPPVVPPPGVPPVSPPSVPPVSPPGVPPVSPPVSPPRVPTTPMPTLVGYPQFAVGSGGSGPIVLKNPDNSTRFSVNPFPDFTGGLRTTAADFNRDGVADLVVGTGPGIASLVLVYDGVTQKELFRLNPFEEAFKGGVFVTSGDLTGDGIADLVITPDEGGGPRLRIFSGGDFSQIADYFGIDDPAFRGGARASVGDITGDGIADLIVAAGFGGGPRVAVFDGTSLLNGAFTKKPFGDFFAFEPALRNGIYVAAGDLNGDGFAELIAGGGPGGGPRVTAFSGQSLMKEQLDPITNFFAGDVDNRGGIRVAVKNLDNDRLADLIVGSGQGAGSRVTAYLGKNMTSGTAQELFAFDAFPGFSGGVFVG